MMPLSRREFVRLGVLSGAGLVLGVVPPGTAAAAGRDVSLHPLIRIGADGVVTIFAQNPEMGQGVKTSLPMIIAEELDVDWRSVRVEQAGWDPSLENQFSGGSLSIRLNFDAMRRAGASARHMLLDAAAQRWQAKPGELATRAGAVSHPATGRVATYGELAEEAAAQPVPQAPALRPAAEFRLIGRPLRDVDIDSIVRGRQVYSIDRVLPDMLYAVVRRCPVSDGHPASFDDREAKAVNGVIATYLLRNDRFGGRVLLPNNPNFVSGVAVLATHTWAAMKGARRLEIEWTLPDTLDDSTALMRRYEAALEVEGERVRDDGDVGEALGRAGIRIDATYRLPFLAHVPMEPMNCTADVSQGHVRILAPTQNPAYVVDAVGKALGVDREQITVEVLRAGGAFGRRYYADFAVDAAILSREFGRPVKVVWTREDDVQHDYYRSSSLHRVRAAVGDDGRIAAWHHKLASHSRATWLERDGSPAEIGDYEFPAGFVPALRYEYVPVPARIPLGQWRAVEHSPNVFVVASVIDELAHAADVDPLEFLLRLIGAERVVQVREDFPFDASRLRHVASEAARRAGWGAALPEGRGRGIAASYNQGSWVAEVAEVTVAGEMLTVDRVTAVIDCGLVVNPNGARAQAEGAIIEGLSAALMGEITVRDGRVEQSNFHDYPLCRMQHVPEIDVHFVASTEPPRGLGEPPLPPVAPAVCNAVFAATGRRIRELPLARTFRIGARAV